MNTIRVLLAEDHETVRQGLRLLLETVSDIEVVGEAPNGRLAVQRSQDMRPHVLILDISMPDIGGLAAARAIRQLAPEVKIVALTRHDDHALVQELMSVGAVGYVLKQSSSTELLNAVRAVASGQRYVDATLANQPGRSGELLQLQSGNGHTPLISEREKEVLRMMAIGHSNKEIAAQLAISVKTVEAHKANAMRKLGFRGRVDVVRYAVLHDWLRES